MNSDLYHCIHGHYVSFEHFPEAPTDDETRELSGQSRGYLRIFSFSITSLTLQSTTTRTFLSSMAGFS